MKQTEQMKQMKQRNQKKVTTFHLLMAMAVLMVIFSSGCSLFDIFKPISIVKHPDSPMLIQEVKGDYLKVSIYDKENNQLIEFRWIPVNDQLHGWTIMKYDWESFIVEESKRRNP